jgi:hypothetical protein
MEQWGQLILNLKLIFTVHGSLVTGYKLQAKRSPEPLSLISTSYFLFTHHESRIADSGIPLRCNRNDNERNKMFFITNAIIIFVIIIKAIMLCH